MAWYRIGTVSVTNGSPNVQLTGGDALQNIFPDDGFAGPDGRIYPIQTIGGSDVIILATNYAGDTATAQPYTIVPVADFVQLRSMLETVNELITDYQVITLKAGIGLFDGGVAASPGVRGVDHEGTGLVWNGDDTLSISIAGTIVATFNLDGLDGYRIDQIAEQLAMITAGGIMSYATVADLPDDPVPENGTTARVYDDPDNINNVFWVVKGGAWEIDTAYAAAIALIVGPMVDAAAGSALAAGVSESAASMSASDAAASAVEAQEWADTTAIGAVVAVDDVSEIPADAPDGALYVVRSSDPAIRYLTTVVVVDDVSDIPVPQAEGVLYMVRA